MPEITQERLKELLNYNPETGKFTWLMARGSRAIKNGIAGTINSVGYTIISIGGSKFLAHRLAFLYMNGEWPENEVDHINHARTDNRWINLRKATRQENGRNASLSTRNKSGRIGVSWSSIYSQWVPQICVAGKRIWLGRFDDIENAIKARKNAEIRFGFHQNHGL